MITFLIYMSFEYPASSCHSLSLLIPFSIERKAFTEEEKKDLLEFHLNMLWILIFILARYLLLSLIWL